MLQMLCSLILVILFYWLILCYSLLEVESSNLASEYNNVQRFAIYFLTVFPVSSVSNCR